MQRSLLILLIMFCSPSLRAQTKHADAESKRTDSNPHARYVGKYEMDGNVIQFALQNGRLVLAAPGAPIQELEYLGINKFQSRVFKDQHFVFVESNGQVVEVNTGEQPGGFNGKKIADNVELLSLAMDSLLTSSQIDRAFSFAI